MPESAACEVVGLDVLQHHVAYQVFTRLIHVGNIPQFSQAVKYDNIAEVNVIYFVVDRK